MKKILLSFALAGCILTTGCVATRSITKINKVEVGMDKSDIKKLLGTPEYRNGDADGEQWGYHKMVGEIAGPEEVLFVVTFDNNGRVVSYDTVKEFSRRHH